MPSTEGFHPGFVEKKDTQLADRLILPFIVLLRAWMKSKVFVSRLLMFKKMYLWLI